MNDFIRLFIEIILVLPHSLNNLIFLLLESTSLIVLLILPIGLSSVFIALVLKLEQHAEKNNFNYKKNKPTFLSDREIVDAEDDQLKFKSDAIKFANSVLNGESNNPIVFGLDAPWGSGKSSYLNLCKNLVWNKKKNVIVFEFKPILYNSRKQNLFDIFSEELLHELDRNRVNNESLKKHLRSYRKILRGTTFTLFGTSFNFNKILGQDSEKRLKQEISDDIKSIGKKIIVIIDDLDRLYLDDIKSILSVVRNIFFIDYVTFILCYDTGNINSFDTQHKIVHTNTYEEGENENNSCTQYSRSSHELNNQRVNAYFEKIVQVKKTLLLKKEYLRQYFINNLEKIVDKKYKYHFKKFKSAINYFFSSNHYPEYEQYLGDIRKIKRIINFIGENNILKFKFRFLDPDPKGLLQLIFIYINFPHIFKKIYTYEANGPGGFFSVISTRLETTPSSNDLGFQNSKAFKNYIKKITEEEAFLLKELFDVEDKTRKEDYLNKRNSKNFRTTSPIFNGSSFELNKNLRDYLSLIVEGQVFSLTDQYSFHVEKIRELENKTIENIFTELNYRTDKGEHPREVFFNTLNGLVDSREELSITPKTAEDIIEYIIKNLPHYSLVGDFSGIYNGLRNDLIYNILILLDKRGWEDKQGKNYDNSDENITTIAEKIFGNNNNGIIDRMINEKREILGIHDALRFYSAYNNRDSLWNLSRSLEIYGGKEINSKEKMAQKIFSRFKTSYIDKSINMFHVFNSMENDILLGDFKKFITRKFTEEKSNINNEICKIKTSIITSIIYQFGKNNNESIGSFSFDNNRNDNIAKEMQKYLFETCFQINQISNSEYFVNFLLSILSWRHGPKGTDYVPRINEFNKMLNPELLENYWKKNSDRIKQHCRNLPPGTRIFTYNYTALYKLDLENLFAELDKLETSN